MPRPKQPLELAKLKGATKKDPQRYAREVVKNTANLGDPPEDMLPSARGVWGEITKIAIPGVLTESERVLVEVVVNLLIEYRIDPAGFPANKLGHLLNALGRLGMSPADRQRLGVMKTKGTNPFDEF